MQLCQRFQVKTFITLGGLHDEVLHNEERISAAGGSIDDVQVLRALEEPVQLIDYVGPSAIHSLFLAKSKDFDMQSISIWAHAASYLQGTNYKLLLELQVDTTELELSWKLLEEQIENLIARNEQLRQHVEDLRQREQRGGFTPQTSTTAKVIRLDEFIKQSEPEE